MSLLSFLSCRFSTTDPPGSLNRVRLSADIEQRTERQPEGRDPYEFDHVEVVLTDGDGAAIEQPAVKVLMNGDPLTFVVGRGNYYDRHPRYILPKEQIDRLRPDMEYAFSVVWTDGQTYPAGAVRTPKPLGLSQITVPETHNGRDAVHIAWRDLGEPCDLFAFRGYEYPDALGNLVQEIASVNAAGALRQPIGPGAGRSASGTMTVPASYFAADGKRRVAALGVEVTRTRETPAAKPFAAASRLRAVRALAFRTEIPAAAR